MNQIFSSPQKYIQGRSLLKNCAQYLQELGQKALIITDEMVWTIAGKELEKHLIANGMEVIVELFQGESSEKEINRIVDLVNKETCEVVIGLGGGKAIDTAKAISNRTESKLAILPTSASTDAPTSAISVLYSDTGLFEKYVFYKKNPELVLVDTEVISKAPVRLLKSGIGDAMATWIEARAVAQRQGENLIEGQSTLASLAIAEKCEAILFEYGFLAVAANEKQVVTKALEAVIEANTLLSGIGFESGGLGAAHAIHNGFSALQGEIHRLTHGEKVVYGTLTQLMLENCSTTELDRYIVFYQELGLPTTLKEMHLENCTYTDLLQVGELATSEESTIHQAFNQLTAQDIADALLAVDAYVSRGTI